MPLLQTFPGSNNSQSLIIINKFRQGEVATDIQEMFSQIIINQANPNGCYVVDDIWSHMLAVLLRGC